MAAAARRSPAAPGAAERAHSLTAALPNGDPARKRARTAWSALGGAVAPDEPGRNEPCPCGSGAKFKKCCGR